MPDQSEAANEHALIQEITAPLSSLPDDPVPIAADTDFPIVLRGYDRIAVDAYVKRTSQLVAELQATRSPEAAIRRALERVGEQISGILQRAHETSQQITSQSRSEAEDRLEVARREAQELTEAAASRVRELDAETDRIWAERQRIVEDARALADQLLALADEALRRFPAADEAVATPLAAPSASEEAIAPESAEPVAPGSAERDAPRPDDPDDEPTTRLPIADEGAERDEPKEEARGEPPEEPGSPA